MSGTDWDVIEVDFYKNGRRRGDGDTVTLWRTGIHKVGDKRWRMTDPEDEPASIRLVWVDTPESGNEGYRAAADDLTDWMDGRNLRVITYESAGWDRLLGDVIDADTGESASQWLMTERGWPAYVKGQ